MEYTGLLSQRNTTNTSNLSDCHSIPSLEPRFVLALQITVGTTCVLSVLGASLIILTYVAFRDLRTTARQLLVNLSIADIVVAASHFVGLLAVFDLYRISNPCSASLQLSGDNVSATIIAKETVDNVICQVQGGFTLFGTLGSFLWTIAVAVYLFVVIVADKPSLGRRLRFVFYPVCWGIPAGIAVAFGVKGYLGFEENLDIGWCYVRWIRSNTTQARDLLPGVLGYQVWLYLAYIMLPVLYLWIRFYVRCKLMKAHHISANVQSRAKTADLKLVFIPLIFLLLRIWSFVLSLPLMYLSFHTRQQFRGTWANAALIFCSGIGSSAQGLANCILFCACTRVVRQKLLSVIKCRYEKKPPCVCMHSTSSHMTAFEESTKYLPDSSDDGISNLVISADMCEEPLLSRSYNGTMNYFGRYNANAPSVRNGTKILS